MPVCSRHRPQDKAQRLAGMCDTLVMGSIFSGQPMLTFDDRNNTSQKHIIRDQIRDGELTFPYLRLLLFVLCNVFGFVCNRNSG